MFNNKDFFIADVTLCTGVKVRAIVQAKDHTHALDSLESIHGKGHVSSIKKYSAVTSASSENLTGAVIRK